MKNGEMGGHFYLRQWNTCPAWHRSVSKTSSHRPLHFSPWSLNKPRQKRNFREENGWTDPVLLILITTVKIPPESRTYIRTFVFSSRLVKFASPLRLRNPVVRSMFVWAMRISNHFCMHSKRISTVYSFYNQQYKWCRLSSILQHLL